MSSFTDSAQHYSTEFIGILEHRLDQLGLGEAPTPDEADYSRWDQRVLQKLHDDLQDLELGPASDRGINALISHPREKLQMTGVGLADDFETYVKMGLLLGSRNVLWDATIKPWLRQSDHGKFMAVSHAVHFLRWREAVRAGGIIILPHPRAWLPDIQQRFEELRPDLERVKQESLTAYNTQLGLINAASLIEANIGVSPYMFAPAGHAFPRPADLSSDTPDPRDPDQHEKIGSLLREQRFAYLRDASPSRFFSAITRARAEAEAEADLGRSLLTKLNPQVADTLGPVEKLVLQQRALEALAEGVTKQNAAIAGQSPINEETRKAAMRNIGAVVGIVSSLYGLFVDGKFSSGISAIGGMLGVPAAIDVFKKWKNRPVPPDIVFQAFALMQDPPPNPGKKT